VDERAAIQQALESNVKVDASRIEKVDGHWVIAVSTHSFASPISVRESLRVEVQLVPPPSITVSNPGESLLDIDLTEYEQSRFSRFTPPANEWEIRLCDLLSQITGRAAVGAEDELFDLGVDSFGTVQLCALLDERYGASLEMSEAYNAATARGISSLLRGRERI